MRLLQGAELPPEGKASAGAKDGTPKSAPPSSSEKLLLLAPAIVSPAITGIVSVTNTWIRLPAAEWLETGKICFFTLFYKFRTDSGDGWLAPCQPSFAYNAM